LRQTAVQLLAEKASLAELQQLSESTRNAETRGRKKERKKGNAMGEFNF